MARYLMVALLSAGLLSAGCDKGDVGKTGPGGLPEGKVVTDLRTLVDVPATAKPITADGKLDEAAWKDAVAVTGFVAGKGKPAAQQSRMLVTYDKDNLYIAVINDEPDTAKLVTKATQRDDKLIWSGDDHIELYVDPDNSKEGPRGKYFAFFVTPANIVYDRSNPEEWDAKWTSDTSVVAGKAWVVELAIPWKEIGVTPKAGHKFGLMVSRDRRAGTKGSSGYLVDCDDEAKDTKCYPTFVLK